VGQPGSESRLACHGDRDDTDLPTAATHSSLVVGKLAPLAYLRTKVVGVLAQS